MSKTPAKTGAEQDVISRKARRVLCYLRRPGVAAGIKRGMRRRDRHAARAELRGLRYA